jgi:signal transduction histidine kinase
MTLIEKIKPKFWDHQDVSAGPYKPLFNFRRIWRLAVLLTAGVTLVPLIFMAFIDYRVTQQAIESEILLRTARLVSNTRRSIAFFLGERKSALDFINKDNPIAALNDPNRLMVLLKNLKEGFGGFVDLGVIDSTGVQRTYVGPYHLEGINYSNQEWFRQVVQKGLYISDVFEGFRQVPHLVIAAKHDLPGGSFSVLRATLETERFNDLLSGLEMSGLGDAFIINRQGNLQTPSHSHGKVLDRVSFPIPQYAPKTQVFERKNARGGPQVVGYAYISETPFILMIVKQKRELMNPWYRTRMQLIGFLVFSVTVILLVILWVATYLVNRIFMADQRRVMTLHQVEYSNKMASLGRLASGVAHEINNPLAIINEKAGLIKDLFTFKAHYAQDQKLVGLVDSILLSVQRCAAITKRLLGFARHLEVTIQPINLEEGIREILSFLEKEAEYRSIVVSVAVLDEIPTFESDRGKLQQIFLNVVNNAFAALADGGRLDITVKRIEPQRVSIAFSDNGCGIPETDLKRVFEPFFTTKAEKGGTGLGLSITYGLVQELGGEITVQSEIGKGTTFTIILPLDKREKEN